MDLSFTEQQEMLRRSARDFLAKEAGYDIVRTIEKDGSGFSRDLWRKIADLGWLAIPFPEKYGGAGGDIIDLVVLAEEMGRAVFPGPYLSTVVLSGEVILEAGTEEQKKRWVPQIVAGERVLAFALTEPSATYSPEGVHLKATKRGDAWHLDGVKLFVRDAQAADAFLVVARSEVKSTGAKGLTLFLVDAKTPGITITSLKGIGTMPLAEVAFANVKASEVLGEAGNAWPIVERVLERASVVLCAEMVGGAQKALEMTVGYAKQRVQFGVPIGTFQAVQHRCADMLTDVDTSRLLTYHAAWKVAEGLPATLDVAMAKQWVSNANKRVTRSAHQVHGGAGYLTDHNLQFYFRNAKANELYLGDATHHRRIVQRALGYV